MAGSRIQDVIMRDTRANQPDADTVSTGALYYVTDEGVTERSNGTTWDDYSDTGSSGITELTGDVTAGPGSGSEAATIPSGTVTYAKMQDVSAADRLLGRGNGGGSGDVQEISLGTNLSLSGTTLNATGSGAPDDAEYIVAAAHASLSAERVATDVAATSWDFGTAAQAKLHVKKVIGAVFDGGGAALAPTIIRYIRVPWAGTITKVTMLADQTCAAVVDIWKDTFANYPPDNADSITAAAPPTLAGDKSEDSTLTGWTTAITAGDVLAFALESNDVAEVITVELEVTF